MTLSNRPKKLASALLFTITLTASSFAQKGEYNLEELQKKYPDQVAVLLSHDQNVEMEVDKKTGDLEIFVTTTEVTLYLKESAKFYTDESISLSHFFEDIVEVEALSRTASGKKMKVDEEDFRIVDSQPSSWVFHDDNKEMVFEYEELGEGYTSELTYTMKIKRPEFFDVFHFIHGYPVLKGSVTINIPAGMQMKFYERAMDGFEVERKTEEGKKGASIKSWIIRDLPQYKTEEGSTNIKNHIPHLVAQIQSYQYNGETKDLIKDVSDLHDYFEEFLLLKGDESNRKELNDVVRDITKDMDNPMMKMDTIFRWVQANIKYLAFEDGINGYVPRACSAVMKNRYGDCKDMGNLLVEMLNFAGVKNAYVAWVGTRDIPYLMSEIPSPLTCNHVICVVERPEDLKNDHKYYYLDATNPEGSYLLPPKPIQGKELLIHYGTGKFDLYKVPPTSADKNYIRSVIHYKFTEDDSLYGSGTDYYGGYERESRAYYIENLKHDDLDEYVKDMVLGGANRYTLKEYEIEGLNHAKDDLEIHYDFSVDNLGIEDGDDIILNPSLFKPRVTKYHTEDYEYARKKSRHRTIDYKYVVEIPENYRVKHLPEDVHYKHDKFHFDAEFRIEGNKVIVTMKYQYHLLEIPPSLFEDWNEFSKSINTATIQNIILEKI
ncbi:MAG: DUF3857 and transglutaminase domain-containing protein [Crocinitomicaceae bacterium]|nr:DUF3857 and transglutaminase domain-containing protein [Crocinitomicaceae bacterium]